MSNSVVTRTAMALPCPSLHTLPRRVLPRKLLVAVILGSGWWLVVQPAIHLVRSIVLNHIEYWMLVSYWESIGARSVSGAMTGPPSRSQSERCQAICVGVFDLRPLLCLGQGAHQQPNLTLQICHSEVRSSVPRVRASHSE